MQSGLQVSVQKALNLIRKYEGLSLKPYICPAGIPTIGYGSTYYLNGVKVTMKDPAISLKAANELLEAVVMNFYRAVYDRTPHTLNDNQLGALLSFAYNVGVQAFSTSTLLRKINYDPSDPLIRDEFLKWNKSNGVVLRGLVTRRAEEANLYFTPQAPDLKIV